MEQHNQRDPGQGWGKGSDVFGGRKTTKIEDVPQVPGIYIYIFFFCFPAGVCFFEIRCFFLGVFQKIRKA